MRSPRACLIAKRPSRKTGRRLSGIKRASFCLRWLVLSPNGVCAVPEAWRKQDSSPTLGRANDGARLRRAVAWRWCTDAPELEQQRAVESSAFDSRKVADDNALEGASVDRRVSRHSLCVSRRRKPR